MRNGASPIPKRSFAEILFRNLSDNFSLRKSMQLPSLDRCQHRPVRGQFPNHLCDALDVVVGRAEKREKSLNRIALARNSQALQRRHVWLQLRRFGKDLMLHFFRIDVEAKEAL